MYAVAIAFTHEDMRTVYDTLCGRFSCGYFTSMKEQTKRAKEIVKEICLIAASHDEAIVTGRDNNNNT